MVIKDWMNVFEAVDHKVLTEQVTLLLKGETVKTPGLSFFPEVQNLFVN